jgi:hypothetical protein
MEQDEAKRIAAEAGEAMFPTAELDEAIEEHVSCTRRFFDENKGEKSWCGRILVYLDSKQEGKRQAVMVGLPEMPPTHEQRCELMRSLGAKLAKEKMRPVAAVSILETWVATGKSMKEMRNVRPSEHPDRREAITFSGMTVDGRTSMSCVDIKRGPDDGIELGETRVVHRASEPENGTKCENYLMIALFQGFVMESFAQMMFGTKNNKDESDEKCEREDRPDWDKMLASIPDGIPKDMNWDMN